MARQFTRREIIVHLRNLLGTAGIYPLLPATLQADNAGGDDEHYFIFVELKGGVHYGIATDCPDPQALPADENIVMPLILNNDGTLSRNHSLTAKQLEYINYSGDIGTQMSSQEIPLPVAYLTNGYFAALPPCFAHGKTTAGYPYRLGWSASPLQDYVDKISVLRGVYMQGTFHGPANEEIYSGVKDGSKPHVAGVLAKLLAEKYKDSGEKPLDNLVLDGAAYVVGNGALPAVKLPSSAISKVVEKIDSNGFSLEQSRKIMEALQKKYGFAGMENIVNAYRDSFDKAKQIKQKLATSGVGGGDISLDVKRQLDAGAAFFKNNLARVVTICTGKQNSTNNAPPFGIFDAHGALYANEERDFVGLEAHSKILRDAMQGIADFIKSIEDPQGENHALKDKVTLIISSEYGRNNNFAGSLIAYSADYDEENEENGYVPLTKNLGLLGNGHFFPNNNYIFYGKGIQGGAWLGESDPVTRFPYCVDFAALHTAKAQNIAKAFIDPLASRPKAGGKVNAKKGFGNVGIDFDPNRLDASKGVPHKLNNARTIRTLMARDAVRTILHSAGQGDKYAEYYGSDANEELPAYAIKQLLRG